MRRAEVLQIIASHEAEHPGSVRAGTLRITATQDVPALKPLLDQLGER